MTELNPGSYPWLTSKLLATLLHKSGESDAHVVDFVLHDAVSKSENYTSHMIRVFVKHSDYNGNLESKSFVIKTALAPELHDQFEKSGYFEREVSFYRNLLPNLIKYRRMFNKSFQFCPTPYEISENPIYFIFEDLKTAHFRNIDRRIGLNFDATAIVLQKLATYHAMSAMLIEEYPDLLKAHKTSALSSTEDDYILDVFMCGMKDCQELCSIWPGYEHLVPKIGNLLKTITTTVATTFDVDPDEFKVVAHGDLWMNNIMYSFDDQNRPNDVIMVDFQNTYCGSPAIDLAYLLYSSTASNIQECKWDKLIQIYHTELVRILKAIGYPKRLPTLTDIHIHMLKRSKFAVLASLMFLGPRYIDNIEHANLEWFVFKNEKSKRLRHELFAKDEVRARAQYLLDFFDRKGFLD